MKEKICGIYCIHSLIDDKKYIGQSVDLYSRNKNHFDLLVDNLHYNKHLQYAFNKYDSKNFKFVAIEECKKEELDKNEIYWIEFYDTFKNHDKGYNLTPGGEGAKGESNSGHLRKGKTYKEIYGEEKANKILKKASESLSGKNNPMYGKHRTIEEKKKIGNRYYSKEIVSGKNNGMFEKTHYSIWLEKYGKDEADKRYEKFCDNKRGNKNGMFEKSAVKNKIHINNGEIETCISIEKLTEFIEKGFIQGCLKTECKYCFKKISKSNIKKHIQKCKNSVNV